MLDIQSQYSIIRVIFLEVVWPGPSAHYIWLGTDFASFCSTFPRIFHYFDLSAGRGAVTAKATDTVEYHRINSRKYTELLYNDLATKTSI